MVKWCRFRQTSLLLLRHDVFLCVFLFWQMNFWRVKFSWVSTPKRKKSNHHLFSQVLGPGIVFSPLKHQRDRIGRNSCLVSGLLYMQPLQFCKKKIQQPAAIGVCGAKNIQTSKSSNHRRMFTSLILQILLLILSRGVVAFAGDGDNCLKIRRSWSCFTGGRANHLHQNQILSQTRAACTDLLLRVCIPVEGLDLSN